MAIGLPVKANYAAGDILTATNMNDLSGTLNEVATNIGFGQAGKNKIINGDFSVNQRAFTSTTSSGLFIYDRYNISLSGGTVTFSAQTFTPGAAPVAGYEGKNYLRMVTSGQVGTGDFAGFSQFIEGVRTFAGQTMTVSFWAKAATGTPSIAPVLQQNFGTGGSPSATVQTNGTPIAITTSWARYSQTFNVPSISGKTIGTNNNDFLRLGLWGSLGSALTSFPALGLQNNTFEFWGLQVEYGAKATPFQTASGGSIEGELAMCQRYYTRINASQAYFRWATGMVLNSTTSQYVIPFKQSMRTTPSFAASGSFEHLEGSVTGSTTAPSLSSDGNGLESATLNGSLTSANAGYAIQLRSGNSTASYLEFSAEL
jgi:hypothetical protein